jgi:two-component system, response regulator YesN
MYSLIIIDDEAEIRSGLADYFDWEELGFSVAAMFDSPMAALDYMERNRVDVALTDVRMPAMSGLEFARKIRERVLPARLVFLSGYKEFDYVKTAMEYKAVAYLLKPVTSREINKVFSEIKAALDAEAAREDEAGAAAGGETPAEAPVEDRPAAKFRRLQKYIEENYASTSLEDAAAFMNMNPFYLSKYFKKMSGTGFSDYLLKLRMEKAQRLISKVDLKIHQIGKIVGYSNANNFSRAFRKYYGKSPGNYARDE